MAGTPRSLHAEASTVDPAAALRAAGLGTWEVDCATRAVRMDAAAQALAGFAPGAFDGAMDGVLARVHADDRARVVAALDAAIAARGAYRCEYRVEARWLLATGGCVVEPDGRVARVVGVVCDVTLERADARQAEHARVAVDATPVVIAYIGADERYEFSNRHYAERFGRPREGVVGRTVREVIGDEAYARIEAHVRRALAGEVVAFETRLDRPGDTPLVVSATYVPDVAPDGRVRGFAALSEDITENRRADALRRESEQRFRRLADVMAQLVWVTDGAGVVEFCNARWYEYTGIAPGDLSRASWLAAVHADDAAAVLAAQARALASGAPFVVEYRVRRRDGEYRWFLARTVFVRDAAGATIERFGTATDIHDQKIAEHRHRLYARAAAALTSVLDLETRAARAAELAVELLGGWAAVYLVDERGELAVRATAHADPSKRARVAELHARIRGSVEAQRGAHAVARTGVTEFVAEVPEAALRAAVTEPGLAELLLDTGLRAYVCVALHTGGAPFGAITIATGARAFDRGDVSAAEEFARTISWAMDNARLYGAQQRSLALLETFLGTAPIGMAFFDRELRHVMINQALADFGGVPMADALGQTLEHVLPALAPMITPLLQRVLATGQPVLDAEVRESAASESPRAWRGSFYPVRVRAIDGDEVLGVGAVVAEVTQQNRAREALEQAVRARDEFLATLSHELRTPLNAILGYVQMLRGGVLAPERTAYALEVIDRNARAQTRLIEDLLDASRIVSGKMRLELRPTSPADVANAALDALRPAAVAKAIRLEAQIDASRGLIVADPDRLQQVVWNLLSNAIRFTPAGGRVALAIAETEASVSFTVSDTGQGIPPELRPHVFERFRQGETGPVRAHGGLGLGLAIVKQLVELHGGTVVAESDRADQGAVFRVVLPRVAVTSESFPPARS